MKTTPRYTVDRSEYPPSCLPSDLEADNLIDITAHGDSWRKYLEPATGKIHDGAEYYAEMQKAQSEGV